MQPNTLTRTYQLDGYEIFELCNEWIRVAIVPRLGARIFSLYQHAPGREWLWRPADGRGLFANHPNDPFEASPLVGVDECLPTVLPCQLNGQQMPDHGECWQASWALDRAQFSMGKLCTQLELQGVPLRFERRMRLADNRVICEYSLSNISTVQQPWIYAFHALFAVDEGDTYSLPGNGEVSGCAPGQHMKLFLPAKEPCATATIVKAGGGQLTLTWTGARLPWLAFWMTKGAWHGHWHCGWSLPIVTPMLFLIPMSHN